MKLAVFVSGGGTNLQSIINAIGSGYLQEVEISFVLADRACYALERAGRHQIPNYLIPRGKQFADKVEQMLESYAVDYIVLAGFLSILPSEFCQKWEGKIINIHPSLLPKFGGKGMYGKHVHQAVLDANENISGATVHFVTPVIDEGEILKQGEFPVEEGDSVEDLQRKVAEIEQVILIEAIKGLVS